MKAYLMSHLLIAAVFSVFVVLLSSGCAFAHPGHTPEETEKHGILLVAFGSSMPEGEAAITAVANAVKKANPGVEVRIAYTSRIIMRKVAKEQKRVIDEPAVALAKMAFDGFTDVAVLSTHIIPGAEYQDLEAVVDGFKMMGERGTKAGFHYLGLSQPLLSNANDFERLAQVLTDTYAKEGRDGSVVFVGHGTHHFADSAYSALQTALWRKSPNFFVGTVEGMPSYDDVLAQLKKTGRKRVAIAPAMLVAGDHAHNDIAGTEEDSWRTMLTAEGFTVSPKVVGLGQNEGVQKLLIDKLREAWGEHKPQ